jgi:hypothetical protein
MKAYITNLSMLERTFGRIIFLKFIYSYVHTLFGHFSLLPLCTLLLPQSPSLPGRTCSALFSNFVEEYT